MRIHCLRTLVAGATLGALFLTGCSTLTTSNKKAYEVVAYKPHKPGAVRVKVSLQSKMVYVMEGDRPLLVTPTTIGKQGATTPTGTFRVFAKIQKKRSNTYGFWANGSTIVAGTSGKAPGGGYHYVGYPMAYWVGRSLADSTFAWLPEIASECSAEVLCSGPRRHTGQYRSNPTRGSDPWQESAASERLQRPRSACRVPDFQ
jgi:L,D-transpeptidase catalytic domain